MPNSPASVSTSRSKPSSSNTNMAKSIPTMTRVYNRSGRSFIHDKFIAAPHTFTDVPAEVADLWLKDYPKDIIESATAQRELGGAQAELAEAKNRIAELEAALKAAETKKVAG